MLLALLRFWTHADLLLLLFSYLCLQKHRLDPEQAAAAAAAADKQQKKKQKNVLGGSLALQVEQHTAQVAGIMSAAEFSSLELSEQTAKGIADMNFKHMTEVQVGCELLLM
jgi:hypothetical protein